jgi:hypothetical protein
MYEWIMYNGKSGCGFCNKEGEEKFSQYALQVVQQSLGWHFYCQTQ